MASIEWRLSPEAEWIPAVVIARPDFDDQQYARHDLVSGSWPGEEAVVVGQGTDTVYGAVVGETIQVRVDGRERLG